MHRRALPELVQRWSLTLCQLPEQVRTQWRCSCADSAINIPVPSVIALLALVFVRVLIRSRPVVLPLIGAHVWERH